MRAQLQRLHCSVAHTTTTRSFGVQIYTAMGTDDSGGVSLITQALQAGALLATLVVAINFVNQIRLKKNQSHVQRDAEEEKKKRWKKKREERLNNSAYNPLATRTPTPSSAGKYDASLGATRSNNVDRTSIDAGWR